MRKVYDPEMKVHIIMVMGETLSSKYTIILEGYNMEIIMSKEEMKEVERAACTNYKVRNLVETLKENDMISIDKDHGIVAIHSVAIPVVITRSFE